MTNTTYDLAGAMNKCQRAKDYEVGQMRIIIDTLKKMDESEREKAYIEMKNKGLNENDITAIRSMLFFTKLFTDTSFYKSVETAVIESLFNEMANCVEA